MSQCPSCGGDCGYTKKKGCQYQSGEREWVGLTEEDLKPICDEWRIVYGAWVHDFAKEIEAKLKEKNHGN
jgi:hypothetical protein